MKGFSAEQLLRLPVRVRGIVVGHAVDLLLDPEARRVLGLEVVCKDDEHRFLPLSAAQLGEEEIAVSSALAMLAADELDFYRKRASTLRLLRGATVQRGGHDVGRLADLVLGTDGSISELVVENGQGPRHVRVEEALSVSVEPRRVSSP